MLSPRDSLKDSRDVLQVDSASAYQQQGLDIYQAAQRRLTPRLERNDVSMRIRLEVPPRGIVAVVERMRHFMQTRHTMQTRATRQSARTGFGMIRGWMAGNQTLDQRVSTATKPSKYTNRRVISTLMALAAHPTVVPSIADPRSRPPTPMPRILRSG